MCACGGGPGNWKPKRFRFLVKPPDRADLWQDFIALKHADWVNGTNKAHDLYLENRAAMEAGAILANPNRHTPTEASALEFYYSEVARLGPEAVATEYDNDPLADESKQRIVLTAYHIQNNCLTGLEKREAPDETVCITVGGDVQKLGLHWVALAWNELGADAIIDYDFFPFLTEGRKAADCELLILEGLFASVCLVHGAAGNPVQHSQRRAANCRPHADRPGLERGNVEHSARATFLFAGRVQLVHSLERRAQLPAPT